MKKYLSLSVIFLGVCLIPLFMMGQETYSKKDQRRRDKAQKKLFKEQQRQEDWEKLKVLIDTRQYIFRANTLINGYGTMELDPGVNFFLVNIDETVSQFSYEKMFIGPNGLGGWTSEFMIVEYDVKDDGPKKPLRVEFSLHPKAAQGWHWNVSLKIFNEGNAELSVASSAVKLKGEIVPFDDRAVYKGRPF